MTPLDQVTDRQLVEMAWRRKAPLAAARWPRGKLIQYLEARAPKVRGKMRMKKNLGIRTYVFAQLSRVVGETSEGFPIGLSYERIVRSAKKKFPDSAVGELHIRWYANKMRADGYMIPVHRKRSRWI